MRSALVDRHALARLRKDRALMVALAAAVAVPLVRLCPSCAAAEQQPAVGLCVGCSRVHRVAA